MVTDKNAWDIEQLQSAMGEMKKNWQDHEGRMRIMESFKDSTVEKLIIIFNKLEELQEGDKWIKRVFITSLIAATISTLGSLIVWAFQN